MPISPRYRGMPEVTSAFFLSWSRGITLLAAIALFLLAGCKDFPGADGRYATPGRGGWDNFRAGAPVDKHGMLAMGP